MQRKNLPYMSNDKPKILFVLHLPPPLHGSSAVGSQIYNSKLINESFSCHYINLGTSNSISEIGKKDLKKFIKYFSILKEIIIQLIRNRFDLCYFAITSKGIAFYKDTLLVLLVKIFRVKVVYHFHNKGVSTRQNVSFDNFLYRIVFNKSKVILLSKNLYHDIEKYVKPKDTLYCPNGVDLKFIYSEKKIDKDPVEILFLSNLIESKGIFILLNACRILKERQISYRCTIIGREGDVTAQQLTAEIGILGIYEQVQYIGSKFGDEKTSYFKEADLFVFPSFNDCFPLVLIEAMSFGLPIVSTYEGGIPDIVCDNITGFLVPQKDAVALADKVELLIKEKTLRKKMGYSARMRYEQNFTLQHFEHKLNNILSVCTT